MRKIVAFFAKIISREIMHQRLAGEQTAATFHNEESPPVALTEGLLLKSGGYPTLALSGFYFGPDLRRPHTNRVLHPSIALTTLSRSRSRGPLTRGRVGPCFSRRKPRDSLLSSGLLLKSGGYLLSHGCAVPSAQAGLTSLFGMGRGGTPPL